MTGLSPWIGVIDDQSRPGRKPFQHLHQIHLRGRLFRWTHVAPRRPELFSQILYVGRSLACTGALCKSCISVATPLPCGTDALPAVLVSDSRCACSDVART